MKSNSILKKIIIGFLLTIASTAYIMSVLLHWSSSIILDKDAFVKTLTPLASNQVIKDGIISRFGDAIASPENARVLGSLFLPGQADKLSEEEVLARSRVKVEDIVRKVVDTKQFEETWVKSIGTIHEVFFNSLDQDEQVLDLTSLISPVYQQLEATELAPALSKELPAELGKITIKNSKEPGSPVSKVMGYLSKVTLVRNISLIVLIVTLAIALLISSVKVKTLRSFLYTISFATFSLLVMVKSLSWVQEKFSSDQFSKSIVEVILTISSSLESLLILLLCIIIAIILISYLVQIIIRLIKRNLNAKVTEVPSETIEPEPVLKPKEEVSPLPEVVVDQPEPLPAPLVGPGAPGVKQQVPKTEVANHKNLVQ